MISSMSTLSDVITCFFSGRFDIDIFQSRFNYREALDNPLQLQLLNSPQYLPDLHLFFRDLNPQVPPLAHNLLSSFEDKMLSDQLLHLLFLFPFWDLEIYPAATEISVFKLADIVELEDLSFAHYHCPCA